MSQEQWRLLDKEELPQKGDQCLQVVRGDTWDETMQVGIKQASCLIYRRKIEQPKPLVWSWGKPHKEGIWAFDGQDKKLRGKLSVCEVRSTDSCVIGWWCYIGPIPTIKLPANYYREPVLPQDTCKLCEFSDDEDFSRVFAAALRGYVHIEGDPFVWRTECGVEYKFARIEVSE